MSGLRPSEALGKATESLDRVATVLVSRLADMTEAQFGWPASAGWDATTRGGSHWCWRHERDVAACHKVGESCDGEVVASPGDRTGEAALRTDRAAAHRREVERLIVAVLRDALRLEQLVGLYGPRQATEPERAETRDSRVRADGCSSCARSEVAKGVARWEPASRSVLMPDGDRRPLCAWCRQWFADFGRLPSLDELRQHHTVGRVRRPA